MGWFGPVPWLAGQSDFTKSTRLEKENRGPPPKKTAAMIWGEAN